MEASDFDAGRVQDADFRNRRRVDDDVWTERKDMDCWSSSLSLTVVGGVLL